MSFTCKLLGLRVARITTWKWRAVPFPVGDVKNGPQLVLVCFDPQMKCFLTKVSMIFVVE